MRAQEEKFITCEKFITSLLFDLESQRTKNPFYSILVMEMDNADSINVNISICERKVWMTIESGINTTKNFNLIHL